jgi:LemA protein
MTDTAYDIMSRTPYTLDEDTPVAEVVHFLDLKRIGSVAITKGHTVIGIITRFDLRRNSRRNFYKTTAKEIMSTTPFFLPSTTKVSDVKLFLDKKRIGSVLIGSNTNLQGIITRYDIKIWEAHNPGVRKPPRGGIPVITPIYEYLKGMYNEPVKYKTMAEKAFADIEVTLQKKYDMIPELVKIVEGYANHEKSTLTQVTDARSQWGKAQTTSDKIVAASALDSILSRLLIVSEQYPTLKADVHFMKLQNTLENTETELQHSRATYNEAANEYNLRIRQFPQNLFAKQFKFRELPYWKAGIANIDNGGV